MPGITPMKSKTEMNRKDRGHSTSMSFAARLSLRSWSRVSI